MNVDPTRECVSRVLLSMETSHRISLMTAEKIPMPGSGEERLKGHCWGWALMEDTDNEAKA